MASFVFSICRFENHDIADRVAILLRHLWTAWNDFVWNDNRQTSTSIGKATLDMWQQWNAVQQQSWQQAHVTWAYVHGSNDVWVKLDVGWLKCIVDVVFQASARVTSFGCCFLNSSGQFIRAQTKWQRANMTVLEEHAMALLDAIDRYKIVGSFATKYLRIPILLFKYSFFFCYLLFKYS